MRDMIPPFELYQPALDELDDEVRTAFMGATAADSFARIGDPMPVVG